MSSPHDFAHTILTVMRIARNTLAPRLSPASEAQDNACPRCDAQLMFRRSAVPRIDSCGFESYSLECQECGAKLAGIIDPSDDALLLTELTA